jgi:hypothetical protein
MPTGSSFHVALEPERRVLTGCREAIEDLLGAGLVGAGRCRMVLEDETQPGTTMMGGA